MPTTSIKTRRKKFVKRIVEGLTPNAACQGLGLHATRELARPDVKAAIAEAQKYAAVQQLAQDAPQPAPTPAPAPQKPACDRCGYQYRGTELWKPKLVNKHILCAGCHATWANAGADPLNVLGKAPKPPADPPKADLFTVKLPVGPTHDRRFARDGIGTVVAADSPDPDKVKNADPFAIDHGTHSVASGTNMESDRLALIAKIKADRIARMGDRRYTPDVGGNVAIADANPDDYVVRPRQPRTGAEQ